jgi:putative heme degradation protein
VLCRLQAAVRLVREKDASEATPFDVTNEKVLPFGLDAINQREGINGLYGVHQFFTLLNGQARVHRTESINRIDGSDGSTQVQEIVNTTAYNAILSIYQYFKNKSKLTRNGIQLCRI